MSETLKSSEIFKLLEPAIDAASGNTVTLDKLAAIKIRDYIQANQEAADQIWHLELWMVRHLEASIQRGRDNGMLSSETLAFLEETDQLVPDAMLLPRNLPAELAHALHRLFSVATDKRSRLPTLELYTDMALGLAREALAKAEAAKLLKDLYEA